MKFLLARSVGEAGGEYEGSETHEKKKRFPKRAKAQKSLRARSNRIKGKQQAEEVLGENEDYYRDLVEHSRDLIYAHDLEGRILSVNPVPAKILGYDASALVQMNIRDILAPKVRHEFEAYLARIQERGADAGLMLVQTATGEKRVWEYNNSLRTEGVAIPTVRGMAHDVTERVRAERALRQSEAKYRELADSIADVFFAMDKDLRYTYWNKASEDLTSIPAKDAIGRSIYELFPDTPETRRAERVYLDALRTQQPRSFVNEYQLGDKNYFFEISAYPSASGLSVFVKDITERRRAEEVIQESLERFQIVARATNDAVWDWNLVTNAVWWNEAAQTLFGYSKDDDGPDVTWWYEHIHPEDRERVVSGIHALIESGGRFWSAEYRYRRADGSFADIFDRGYVMHDDRGQPVRMIGAMVDITERKRAEETLVREKEFSEFIINSVPGTFYLFDNVGKMLRWNRNSETVSEYSAEEIAQMSVLDFIAEEDRQFVAQRIREAFEKGASDAEAHLVSKSGKKTAYYFTGSRINVGEKPCLIGIGIDVSKRRQAEEALREREEWFKEIFEGSRDPIFLVDANARFVKVNRAACDLTGYSREELLQMSIPDLYEKEAVRAFRLYFDTIMSGVEVTSEAWLQRRDGTKVPVEFSSRRIVIRGQQLMHMAARDITERKRAEEVLRESQQLLRNVFASLRDAIFIIDADRVEIKDCNPAASEIFGYSHREMLGRTTTFLHVDEPALEEFRKHLYPAIEEKGFLSQFEFRMKRRDGTVFPTEHSVMPLQDEQGKRIGWVSVVRDITERKRAEEALHAARERLQTLSRCLMEVQEQERRSIARELHDEIGQTLTAIKLSLQAAKYQTDLAAVHRYCDESISIAEQAIEQTRSLALDLRPSMLDDLGLVPALRWYLDHQAQRAGFSAQLTIDLPSGRLPPNIEIACFRIVQEAVTNIARHASAKQVWVTLAQAGEELVLSIEDDGVGFDVQAARERAVRGESMGLLGMEERAMLAGGNLEIHSRVDKGTEVVGRFPVR